MRPAAIFLVALLVVVPAGAQKKKDEKKEEPRLVVALPLGAAAGATTKLTLRGHKLDTATAVKLVGSQGKVKLLTKGKAGVPDKNPEKVGDTQVEIELTLDAKLPSEPVQVIVETSAGATKPHPILVETSLPVVKEKEPNDGFKQAQLIAVPAVAEGAIERPKDVDVYRIEGKAGQKLTVEVQAARYGSPLDAMLTVYTPAGQQLAASDDFASSRDARIELTLPQGGPYLIVLIDAHDLGGPVHAYRLVVK